MQTDVERAAEPMLRIRLLGVIVKKNAAWQGVGQRYHRDWKALRSTRRWTFPCTKVTKKMLKHDGGSVKHTGVTRDFVVSMTKRACPIANSSPLIDTDHRVNSSACYQQPSFTPIHQHISIS